MENNTLDDMDNQSSNLSYFSKNTLRQMFPWMLFSGIAIFILLVLLIVFVFKLTSVLPSEQAGALYIAMVFYVILLLPQALFLFSAANNGKKYSQTEDMRYLDKSFSQMRNFWIFMGILFGLALILMIISLLSGNMRAPGGGSFLD